MNKYFIILNWSLLAFVLTIAFWLSPILHTPWLLSGSILSAMSFGGYASWRYHKDKDPHKSQRWRNHYFNKNYPQEIAVQLIIALAFAWPAWWLASFLYFITGFAATLAFIYIIEWLYAHFTHKHTPL